MFEMAAAARTRIRTRWTELPLAILPVTVDLAITNSRPWTAWATRTGFAAAADGWRPVVGVTEEPHLADARHREEGSLAHANVREGGKGGSLAFADA